MHFFRESKRATGSPAQSNPNRHRRRFACLLLLILLSQLSRVSTAQQAAQSKPDSQDQPVRLKADLMELRAVVTDKQGRPITDLNKDDFEILENGREQVVSFFFTEQVAGKRSASRPPGTSPSTPWQPLPAGAPKRTVVFFVDTLNMATLSLLRVKQRSEERRVG